MGFKFLFRGHPKLITSNMGVLIPDKTITANMKPSYESCYQVPFFYAKPLLGVPKQCQAMNCQTNICRLYRFLGSLLGPPYVHPSSGSSCIVVCSHALPPSSNPSSLQLSGLGGWGGHSVTFEYKLKLEPKSTQKRKPQKVKKRSFNIGLRQKNQGQSNSFFL